MKKTSKKRLKVVSPGMNGKKTPLIVKRTLKKKSARTNKIKLLTNATKLIRDRINDKNKTTIKNTPLLSASLKANG